MTEIHYSITNTWWLQSSPLSSTCNQNSSIKYTQSNHQASDPEKPPRLPPKCAAYWIQHLLNSGGHALCLLLSAVIDCGGVFQLVHLLLCLCAPSSGATAGLYRAPQLTILTGQTHYNRVLCSGRAHTVLIAKMSLSNFKAFESQ